MCGLLLFSSGRGSLVTPEGGGVCGRGHVRPGPARLGFHVRTRKEEEEEEDGRGNGGRRRKDDDKSINGQNISGLCMRHVHCTIRKSQDHVCPGCIAKCEFILQNRLASEVMFVGYSPGGNSKYEIPLQNVCVGCGTFARVLRSGTFAPFSGLVQTGFPGGQTLHNFCQPSSQAAN